MVELSKGVEIRAQMDLEVAKALILINGAGIIAILTFLQSTFESVRYASFAKPAIIGVAILVVGLLTALLYIRFGRICSLKYEQQSMRPPASYLFGFDLGRPMPCAISAVMVYVSLGSFCLASAVVGISWYCLL